MNPLYKLCQRICHHKFFKIFIVLCIALNTIALGLDKYPIDDEYSRILDLINWFFYSSFLIEMLLLLIGLGIKEYFSDKYYAFDFAIVLVSSIDVALTSTRIANNG